MGGRTGRRKSPMDLLVVLVACLGLAWQSFAITRCSSVGVCGLKGIHDESLLHEGCCTDMGLCNNPKALAKQLENHDMPLGGVTSNDVHKMRRGAEERSRKKRAALVSLAFAEEVPNTCESGCVPQQLACCSTVTNITLPLVGTSVTTGREVAIAQLHPFFLQPIIHKQCERASCRILNGVCRQIVLPRMVYVINSNVKSHSEDHLLTVDFVYVESGCECQLDPLETLSVSAPGKVHPLHPALPSLPALELPNAVVADIFKDHGSAKEGAGSQQKTPLQRSQYPVSETTYNDLQFKPPLVESPKLDPNNQYFYDLQGRDPIKENEGSTYASSVSGLHQLNSPDSTQYPSKVQQDAILVSGSPWNDYTTDTAYPVNSYGHSQQTSGNSIPLVSNHPVSSPQYPPSQYGSTYMHSNEPQEMPNQQFQYTPQLYIPPTNQFSQPSSYNDYSMNPNDKVGSIEGYETPKHVMQQHIPQLYKSPNYQYPVTQTYENGNRHPESPMGISHHGHQKPAQDQSDVPLNYHYPETRPYDLSAGGSPGQYRTPTQGLGHEPQLYTPLNYQNPHITYNANLKHPAVQESAAPERYQWPTQSQQHAAPQYSSATNNGQPYQPSTYENGNQQHSTLGNPYAQSIEPKEPGKRPVQTNPLASGSEVPKMYINNPAQPTAMNENHYATDSNPDGKSNIPIASVNQYPLPIGSYDIYIQGQQYAPQSPAVYSQTLQPNSQIENLKTLPSPEHSNISASPDVDYKPTALPSRELGHNPQINKGNYKPPTNSDSYEGIPVVNNHMVQNDAPFSNVDNYPVPIHHRGPLYADNVYVKPSLPSKDENALPAGKYLDPYNQYPSAKSPYAEMQHGYPISTNEVSLSPYGNGREPSKLAPDLQNNYIPNNAPNMYSNEPNNIVISSNGNNSPHKGQEGKPLGIRIYAEPSVPHVIYYQTSQPSDQPQTTDIAIYGGPPINRDNSPNQPTFLNPFASNPSAYSQYTLPYTYQPHSSDTATISANNGENKVIAGSNIPQGSATNANIPESYYQPVYHGYLEQPSSRPSFNPGQSTYQDYPSLPYKKSSSDAYPHFHQESHNFPNHVSLQHVPLKIDSGAHNPLHSVLKSRSPEDIDTHIVAPQYPSKPGSANLVYQGPQAQTYQPVVNYVDGNNILQIPSTNSIQNVPRPLENLQTVDTNNGLYNPNKGNYETASLNKEDQTTTETPTPAKDTSYVKLRLRPTRNVIAALPEDVEAVTTQTDAKINDQHLGYNSILVSRLISGTKDSD